MTAFETGGGAALSGPAAGRVGFFGKLPGRGDFVRRDLPNAFVDTWDAWVQLGMEASRATLGEGWLDAWLCAPVWRFALPNGICGPDAWAGVMMPSVDRAGRYFPLTLAAMAPPGVPSAAMLAGDWIAAVEAAALSALGEDTDFDRFSDSVAALPPFPALRAEAWVGGWRARSVPGGSTTPIMALAIASAAQGAHCVFATQGGGRVAPAAWVLPHLPPQRVFVGFMDDLDSGAVPTGPATIAPGMAVPLAIGGVAAVAPLPATDTALGHAASLFGSDFATDVPATLQGEPPGGAFDSLLEGLAPPGEAPPAGAFEPAQAPQPADDGLGGGLGGAAPGLPDAGVFVAPIPGQEPEAAMTPDGATTRRAPDLSGTAPADPWPNAEKGATLSPKELFGDTEDEVPPAPSNLFDEKGRPS